MSYTHDLCHEFERCMKLFITLDRGQLAGHVGGLTLKHVTD